VKREHALFTMGTPNPPHADGSPSSSRALLPQAQPASSELVRHPKCLRVQARQDRSTAHQLDAQALLHFYPHIPDEVMNTKSGGTIYMSHPDRYLPPRGGHFVVGDRERVRVPDSLGNNRCANCHRDMQQDGKCRQHQCPNACGYCGKYHDPNKVSHLTVFLNPSLLTFHVALSMGLQH
jgi:hypothetical protein